MRTATRLLLSVALVILAIGAFQSLAGPQIGSDAVVAEAQGCSPSYPDFCIPPPPPDLNCNSAIIAGRHNFTVLPPDPHHFDADLDGRGCDAPGTDTPTPTAPIVATPTFTVGVPVSCVPRPAVRVTTVHISSDQFRATLVASNNPTGGTNTLGALTFQSIRGATVQVLGIGTVATGQRVPLASGVQGVSLAITQAVPGQSFLVPLTVTDACGEWRTFVGGGSQAHLIPTATLSATPISGAPPYRDPYQFTYSGDAYNCSFFYSQGETQRVLRAAPSDPNNLDSEDGTTDGIACTTYRNWQYPNDADYNPVSRTGVTPTSSSGSPPYRDPYQFVYSGDAYNCSFFYSQGEAQRVLRAAPSDPNRLDSEDGAEDGIACTTYHNWQYPNDADYVPVQRTGSTPTSGMPPYRDPYQFTYSGDAYNCSFFYSQGEAQRVLRANPSDPNHLDSEDGVEDGIACTTYHNWQYPNDADYVPVQRTGSTPTPTVFNPLNYIGQGDRYNCVNFDSQAQTQAVLRADPHDPNHLDVGSPANGNAPDGIACNSTADAPDWAASFYYPQPYDRTPVPTPIGGR